MREMRCSCWIVGLAARRACQPDLRRGVDIRGEAASRGAGAIRISATTQRALATSGALCLIAAGLTLGVGRARRHRIVLQPLEG
jgi:hypothetical protein